MITIDRHSSVPLTKQIVHRFTQAIRQGQLTAGTRLQSIRQLASRLGVSPYTIVIAYDQLAALGLIASHASSGYYVVDGVAEPAVIAPVKSEAQVNLDTAWLTRSAMEADDQWLAAGSSLLPEHWLEDMMPERLLHKVLRDQGPELFKPTHAQGLFALREMLSAYLRLEKIFVSPQCILTTDGATQAIDLICRLLLKPGDLVVVEEPGNPVLLSRLQEQGLHIVAVSRKFDGMDTDALERICKMQSPKAVFTQSVLHNPTGWSSSLSNLHRLLSLAERYDFMIAEDDVYGALGTGLAVRLAQLSDLKHVLYYSSFSEITGSMVKLGFIAAEPHLIEALIDTKLRAVTSCSGLNERIAVELLGSGRYRKHVGRLKRRLAAARAGTVKLLSAIGLHFNPVGEGIFLWGEMPKPVDVDLLVREAYDNQILLAPGTLFHAANNAASIDNRMQRTHLRFNVATSNHPKLARYLEGRISAMDANANWLGTVGLPRSFDARSKAV